jgi:(E)-4-hydroxy-3-methylbut-2-enyl-diphosphate synthase
MCNTDTRDAAATLRQISALAEEGCEIVRVAVPDLAAAQTHGRGEGFGPRL